MEYSNESKPKFNPFLPIWISLVLVLGVSIGTLFNFKGGDNSVIKNNSKKIGKLDNVLDFITRNYVDTIDADSLRDMTLIAMLHSLDPHSDYIPAKELETTNEPLEGNFDGIGVEFNILNDTITVVNPITGGPSEKVGIQSGDKVITVNGKLVAGVKITNKQVFSTLRGARGTKVKLQIKRRGTPGLIDFTITRDEVPIFSIDAAYMVTKETGYIKISRFGATTYSEYLEAFNKLKDEGMKKMIIDLRGNGGGYLNAAVDIADEFLNKGMRIVYTQGKSSPRRDYKASDRGGYENDPLAILIDENSASASEILAGAVQDNDRGILIGRRTFGKGLVQEQLEMPDGSAIRLTTARYYTPTGRCIQKPYTDGNNAYYAEEYERYDSGELLVEDSIKFNSNLKFKTPSGKIVYGGGGIMPDYFVALDTAFRSYWLSKVAYAGLLNDFSLEEVDKSRLLLAKYKSLTSFNAEFFVSDEMIKSFVSYCERNGIAKDESAIKKGTEYLKTHLKALIGRNLLGNAAYYPISQKDDKAVLKAIEVLKKGK